MKSGRNRPHGFEILETIPSSLPPPVARVRPKPTFGRPVKPGVGPDERSDAASAGAPSAPAVAVRSAASPVGAVPAAPVASPVVSRMETVMASMEACDLAARYGRCLPHLDEALAALFGDDAWTAHLERSGSAVRGVDPNGAPLRDLSPTIARYRWSAAGGLTRGVTPSWRPVPPSVALAALHGPMHPLMRPGSPAILWGPHNDLDILPPSMRDVDGVSPLDAGLSLDPASALAEVETALAAVDRLRPGGALRDGPSTMRVEARLNDGAAGGVYAGPPFSLLAFDAVRGNDVVRRQTWVGTPGRGAGPPDRRTLGSGMRIGVGADVPDPRRGDGMEALLGLVAAMPFVPGGDEGDRLAIAGQGGELVVASLETVIAMLEAARMLDAAAFTPATPRFRIRAAAHLAVAGVTAAMRNGGERRWGGAELPAGGARADGLPAYAPIALGPLALVAMLRDLQVSSPLVAMAGFRLDELAEGWEWLRWTAFARVAVEAAGLGIAGSGATSGTAASSNPEPAKSERCDPEPSRREPGRSEASGSTTCDPEMAHWLAGVIVPESGPASCHGLVPRVSTRPDDPAFLDPASLRDALGRNEGHACALLRAARREAGIDDPASALLAAAWTNGGLDLGVVGTVDAGSVRFGRPENGFLRPFDRRLVEEGPLDRTARDRGRLAGVLNRRERHGLEPIAPRPYEPVAGYPTLPENDAVFADGDPVRLVPTAKVKPFRRAVGTYRLEPFERDRQRVYDEMVMRLAQMDDEADSFVPGFDRGDPELGDD